MSTTADVEQRATMVRIPADVDLDDRVLGRLTARQVAILAAAAGLLYLGWITTAAVVPLGVFLAAALPLAAVAAVIALGHRDGISLDRFAMAAATHYTRTRQPRPHIHREGPAWLTAPAVPAPHQPGAPRRPRTPAQLPPRHVNTSGVIDAGVVDLGPDGHVVMAVASAVNFALRTPREQNALIAVFAGYLHSLHAPVQLLIRALPLDLSGAVGQLHAAAPHLEHPALTAAAYDHAAYLASLGEQHELLCRQVIVVLREPAPTPTPTPGPAPGTRTGRWRSRRPRGRVAPAGHGAVAVEARLGRRLAEAVDLLAPAGITLTPLSPDRAAAVLAAACHPAGHLLPPTAPAHPDDVITAPLPTLLPRMGDPR